MGGHLALSLLGPLEITRDGRPIAGFESDKVRALLVYLAVEAERAHRREALAGLLWPELPERVARHNLSQALFNLRQAIDDARADPPFLLIRRETVQFNSTSDYRLDVACFKTLLIACETHRHRRLETCAACAARLAETQELYRGSFLQQFSLAGSTLFEEWALPTRERLQHQVLEALSRLATFHEQRGAYTAARDVALRLLEIDPWRETTYRQLMRVLGLSGQRSAALAQYERCRRVLAAELGVEPESETTAVYERIRDAEDEAPTAEERLVMPSRRPHNLPPQPTPFVGREPELAELAEMLANPSCRLVTIAGLGGIGKTRLALQGAMEQLDTFADGVFFVPLAPLNAPEFVIPTIADALGLALQGAEPPSVQLFNYLHDKEVLVILDNFEHLLPEVPVLAQILQRAPNVTLLVTSRERLNLRGEWLLELGGMPFPEVEMTGEIEQYSAVELFLQNARRVQGSFALTVEDRRYVARICHLVEGLPLGIELAAAWLRVLSCAEIAQEIGQSLAFLQTSFRDVPERHRGLRAVFEHSWDLLNADEQRVLRRLAVFRGGFRRDAAEQVAGTSLPLLATLVDKSLLRKSVAGRYEMHEAVRQHAWERLRAAGELEATQRCHARFFLDLAETAGEQLVGAEQQRWLDRLEREHDNLRTALHWSLADGEAEFAARFGAALWRFWWMHNHLREGSRWLEQATATSDVSPAVRAGALNGLGVILEVQGELVRAAACYEESLQLRRAIGDRRGIAGALNNLGVIACYRGDYGRAQALYEESLALKRELGDRHGIANSLGNLGMVTCYQGDYERARTLFEEGLALSRELKNVSAVATKLADLGAVALEQHDAARAQPSYRESLALFQELGDKEGIADCLEGLAGVALAAEEPAVAAERAARLCGAAEVLRAAIGAPITPVARPRYDRIVNIARERLTPAAFAAAWAKGRAMSTEQVVTYALEIPD